MLMENLLDSLKQYPNSEEFYFKEYKGLNNFYINGLKMAYRKLENGRYNIPIIDYFANIGRLRDIEKLGFNLDRKKTPRELETFDIETKMMYGMPITSKDVIEINKMKIKTRR